MEIGKKPFYNNYDWADLASSKDTQTQTGRSIQAMNAIKYHREALIPMLDLKPELKLIDIGSNNGYFSEPLIKLCDYVGIEKEPLYKAKAEENTGGKYLTAPAEAIPFEDDTFDRTLSFSCYHLFDDKPQAIKEMLRVTKPGGFILLADVPKQELPLLEQNGFKDQHCELLECVMLRSIE